MYELKKSYAIPSQHFSEFPSHEFCHPQNTRKKSIFSEVLYHHHQKIKDLTLSRFLESWPHFQLTAVDLPSFYPYSCIFPEKMALSLLSSILSWVFPCVTPPINPDVTFMMLNASADVPPLPAFHFCQSHGSKLAPTFLCVHRPINSVSQCQFCFAPTCLPGKGELIVYLMRLGLSYMMQMYIIS